MSEYQCYQWKRVGRSLSPKDRREVSELSSHISVRSDSAEVTYHWGDFKHDPIFVLELYFDLFLYEANWGTQRIAFRFDADTVDVEELSRYATGETITVSEKNGKVQIEAWFYENWVEPACYFQDEYGETDWRLEVFETVHRQLMEGDYRGLFLLWLKACELEPEEESDFTTLLPGGMGQLGDEHQVLAEFVGVDSGVVTEAGNRSDALPERKPQRESLEGYLNKLSAESKEAYLQRLLIEDATSVQSALRRELRGFSDRPRKVPSGKTVTYDELVDSARRTTEREAQRIKEEKEKRRRDYLEKLGKREDEIWDRVHALVSEKTTKGYDASVLLLRGLEDMWTEREDRDHFLRAVQVIAEEFPRLTGFRRRLEEAGMLESRSGNIQSTFRRERWEKRNPLQREIELNW